MSTVSFTVLESFGGYYPEGFFNFAGPVPLFFCHWWVNLFHWSDVFTSYGNGRSGLVCASFKAGSVGGSCGWEFTSYVSIVFKNYSASVSMSQVRFFPNIKNLK